MNPPKKSIKKQISECDEYLAKIPSFRKTFGDSDSLDNLEGIFLKMRAEAASWIGRKYDGRKKKS